MVSTVGSQSCTAYSGVTATTDVESYSSGDASNQLRSSSHLFGIERSGSASYDYDAAGELTDDGAAGHQYAYDAEGRLCAEYNGTAYIGYLYNASGIRVAKGTQSSLSCDLTGNGFTMTSMYVLDQGGQTMTETDGSGVWQHTDVGGFATYDSNGLHFQMADWLGTRRVQTDYAGTVETSFQHLPFGELLTSLSGDATEKHFTGKERDTESGLDYFGARYYGSNMGRFMSPDHPLIDQHPENPQSWNLYAYARNNPLINIDPTGLGCITDLGQGSDANHESVEFNNSINSDDCAGQHGTWVPGDVSANNTGAYRGDDGSINFQATTNTGGNVYFSSFVSGAQTDANGVGPGASIAHASTDWLSSQIVGGSLDQMMSFAANRMEPRGGGGLMALLAGPGFSLDAPDNWAGPGGMGTPQGQGDWAAMVHDYNFFTNNITIGTYFNPFVSRATAKALIQSDNYLVGHAGGIQSVKMGMLFGVVNAFQWLSHPF